MSDFSDLAAMDRVSLCAHGCQPSDWCEHGCGRRSGPDICPACRQLVTYDQERDLFEHGDDATDEQCRLDILRGTPAIRTQHNATPNPPSRDKEAEQARLRETAIEQFNEASLTSAEIRDLPPPSWLIEDYLMRDSLAMLYGPSGACKTFLALCWAQHVSSGLWWHGHKVDPGPVFYVIAEGVRGIGHRLDAWEAYNDDRMAAAGAWDGQREVIWHRRAVNLTDPPDMYCLLTAVSAMQPRLVVFDTLARCTLGAEENGGKDMGLVVANLDKIKDETGACVAIIHHTGKDLSAGARGHSALKGAMDTELEITAADHRLVLKVTKQKDDEEAKPLRLDRTPVEGTGSCVLTPAGESMLSEEVSSGTLTTLDALRTVQVDGGVPTSVWEHGADVPRRTFYRHRAELVKRGLVINLGTDRAPRYVVPAEADIQEEDNDGGLPNF